jgi:hypothetical protein
MIAILMISGVLTPLILYSLLYYNLVDQTAIIVDEDGNETVIVKETKAEAQRHFLHNIWAVPVVIAWMIWTSLMIGMMILTYYPPANAWLKSI